MIKTFQLDEEVTIEDLLPYDLYRTPNKNERKHSNFMLEHFPVSWAREEAEEIVYKYRKIQDDHQPMRFINPGWPYLAYYQCPKCSQLVYNTSIHTCPD